jgi:HSP20 family molecular chaperone IbpA
MSTNISSTSFSSYVTPKIYDNKRISKLEQTLKNLQKKIHSPKVDLIERDNFYLVRIELPGILLDSLNVEINESQIVLISGNKTTNNIYETDRVVYKESKYDKFMRRVKLPGKVKPLDFNTNNLDFVNGVLNLTFEKDLNTSNNLVFSTISHTENWADVN